MDRRTFLSKTGATAGLIAIAGCVGPEGGAGEGGGDQGGMDGEGSPTDTPTDTETATPTETATETTTGTGTGTGTGQGNVATHYRFGGEVSGWKGREPQAIADKTNPTIELEAGKTYKVTWENLDGVPHDFTIRDSSGNVITQTKQVSNQGETLTLTFTASQEMAEYICTVHPTSMVGVIEISGGG